MSKEIVIDDLVLRLDGSDFFIKEDERLWTSLNSRYLAGYADGCVDPSKFERVSVEDPAYEGVYRRIFGPRRIHLGPFGCAGFLNERYDVSFGFKRDDVLSETGVQLCDPEILFRVLYQERDASISDLFKNEYEAGLEVVVPILDLSRASIVLTYSSTAQNEVNVPWLSHVRTVDLADFRKKALTRSNPQQRLSGIYE